MFDKLLEVISVFGDKSAPADTLTSNQKVNIYNTAVDELYKSQDELGSMGERGLADNPYFIELLSQYPDFAAFEKTLGNINVGYQKYGHIPRAINTGYEHNKKSIKRFEEAKKDTSYYKQSIMDSLIQAYGFDKFKNKESK